MIIFTYSGGQIRPFLFDIPSPSFEPTMSHPIKFLYIYKNIPHLFLLFLIIIPYICLSGIGNHLQQLKENNMAFRLRPLHEDTLQFAGLSNTQILILALEASQKLEWNIEELTLEGVRFDVPMSIKSHGEEITVSIQEGSDGEISVRSQSIAMQLVDYGKNRKNIQSLQKAMEEIKSTLSPEELEQKAKKLEDDFNRPLTEEEEAYLKEIEKKSSLSVSSFPGKDL